MNEITCIKIQTIYWFGNNWLRAKAKRCPLEIWYFSRKINLLWNGLEKEKNMIELNN